MRSTKLFLLSALLLALLCGCGRTAGASHPEWEESWVRLGDTLAAETPEGFTLEREDSLLAASGKWLVIWSDGAERKTVNASGEEGTAYDAEIFMLADLCQSEAQAERNVDEWIAREREFYECSEVRTLTSGGQSFRAMELRALSAENPYARGACAFAVRDSAACSIEVVCAEDYDGDAWEILQSVLGGLHFGEGS